MPTTDYRNEQGERLPGVTTIIGNLGWNKSPLMWWAWNEGKEGRNFRDTSQRACEAGTICHAMIEAELKGRNVDDVASGFEADGDTMDKAESGYLSFLEWQGNQELEVVATEIHLTSKQYGFGGTPDVIVKIGDAAKLAMLDLKTSNGVYADYLLQLSAYEQLWLESGGDPFDGGLHLLRVGKDEASFHHHYWQALPKAWDAFLHALELHKLHKELKRLV